jgi:hypothetical protein
MKPIISLSLLISITTCSCNYWQPFPIKMKIRVVTTDDKPVVGHRVKVEQSLMRIITPATTDSKGEAMLTVTTQLDESNTDIVTISGDETDLYLPITKSVFYFQRDDKTVNINIVLDTVRYQKIRFTTKSNKIAYFTIRGHNLTTTEGSSSYATKNYDYLYNDFWGQNIQCNYKPLCKTYPNLDSVVFASCFNMLPKLTLSVGVNTPQADTV